MNGCRCLRHRKYGPRTETAEDRQLRADMHEIARWQTEEAAHKELVATFNDPRVSPSDKERLFHLRDCVPSMLRFSRKMFPFLEQDSDIEYAKSLRSCLDLPGKRRHLNRQFRFEKDDLAIETHRGEGLFGEIGRFPLTSLQLELEIRDNPCKDGCVKKGLIVHVHYRPAVDSLDSSTL
ncbi:MAG: hypothetical protein UX58_C0003G0086 [Candidatus Wolfebacteria bacterium GW2011_GWB2_46_69]|uniref:Uncharacterized protein n=1 Tax=Candidatus Wolfebacteria bacterium GW2011_GWA2_47_9b TaxID=1619005 RepID=A0A0G1U4W7_9BACT|nr:MAG: hypothetical protein UX58_C0003G0086 [Candidatus Wolfebacteria bacterium GW2011_GWB2_46_69]KKU54062.1 MAG: hypothetical protein UX76_C0006G0028 [Candidatus Wolfebacteria bacterium GW2011_GWC1_47_103]KKU59249.1 MAG: hypothetical protein UX83_C0006G0019 [Candidatus Wolfebacteria bacterium GW2011_GWE2_47_12]KKU72718.1 MAG: hypothetical protein UX96_C0016G0029 [Candidatus Wolfebacteria bacterium GW2011_GWB1_47_243]KKU89106.1 MAG: hypothetical protein UY19_C0019G0023 [Candidatus Wolfebacteri